MSGQTLLASGFSPFGVLALWATGAAVVAALGIVAWWRHRSMLRQPDAQTTRFDLSELPPDTPKIVE